MKDSHAVEIRDVTKRFLGPGGRPESGVVAVDDVSLQIRDGEFFSLLGPSGCGKTTTLRMIAGFEHPTSGEIYIHGKPMGLTPPYQRNTNMVFQSYALFPHMTIARNVAFGLEMRKVPKQEVERRVQEALDMVRLPNFGSRRPNQLSGGQQQRIALARALVNRPEVLLLDEPLGAPTKRRKSSSTQRSWRSRPFIRHPRSWTSLSSSATSVRQRPSMTGFGQRSRPNEQGNPAELTNWRILRAPLDIDQWQPRAAGT